ncbi:MAG: zinc-dependent metalloprotease [Gammaproteobacteria bacterium]|nr:zinc-dependent metalloprotease [Gammaproteobacteria bacterium]
MEAIGEQGLPTLTDSGGRIDLLVAYTKEAAEIAKNLQDAFGNPIETVTDIDVAIQHSVDTANFVLITSGAPTYLNLVHKAQVKDAEPDVKPKQMLDYMEVNTSYFDELLDLGDQYRADLTTLMVAGGGQFTACGISKGLEELVEPAEQSYFKGRGKLSVYGKNVVKLQCAVINLSLVHEVGHNLGLSHDFYGSGAYPANDQIPIFTEGRGYVAVPIRKRTVMAYDSLCWDYFPDERPHAGTGLKEVCARLPLFSSPQLYYDGYALGLTGGGFVKPVNAVSSMKKALWTVANFRHSLMPPP